MFKAMGVGVAWALARLESAGADDAKKTHVVTLSFDDGFKKSSLRTAEIYEKHGLHACINVIATAHLPGFVLPNEYHRWPVGDFGLWNELQSRGHEIMPHGFKHVDKSKVPLEEAKDLIQRCLDYFTKELKGFRAAEGGVQFSIQCVDARGRTVAELARCWHFARAARLSTRFPHRGQKKLTCTSYGPDGIDEHLTGEIDKLLAQPSGWLIYNTHGLDDEGWGPLQAKTLEKLLERLAAIPTVAIVPAGRALLAALTTK